MSDENILVDWACGRIWMLVSSGRDIHAEMTGKGGHATLVRGDAGAVPRFHPEAEPLALMAAALRRKYDPKGILNPGLMG